MFIVIIVQKYFIAFKIIILQFYYFWNMLAYIETFN